MLNKLSGYRTIITLVLQILIVALVQRGYLSENATSEEVVRGASEGILLIVAQVLSLKGIFWRLKASKPGPLSKEGRILKEKPNAA